MSTWQSIMTKVDTALEAILTSNGYETNLGTSIHPRRDLERNPFADDELPALSYADRVEAQEAIIFRYDYSSIVVQIIVVAETETAIRSAIADVVKAVSANRAWDGLALDTVFTGSEIDIVHLKNKVYQGAFSVRIDYLSGIGTL